MITTLLLAATLTTCSWDRPGADRFTGDIVSAVDDYTDLPVDVREKLKDKLSKHRYDDAVEISRDDIVGLDGYSDLREMHFGANRVCKTVTRQKWRETSVERGLIYCVDETCVIVPSVCGNISRVTRHHTPLPVTPRADVPLPVLPTPTFRMVMPPLPPLPPIEPLPEQMTVPEPSTLWLMLGALGALVATRRRK